jgi:hypothetical protein
VDAALDRASGMLYSGACGTWSSAGALPDPTASLPGASLHTDTFTDSSASCGQACAWLPTR